MRRLLFYILRSLAFMSRMISNRIYMALIVAAHKAAGVKFVGKPEYIHTDAYLDPSGGLTIYEGAVISTRTIILTHDWSFLKRAVRKNREPFAPVIIGRNSFIGAGAIILSGSIIGENCIVGAGAVVKGEIEDRSIVIGNPSKIVNQS